MRATNTASPTRRATRSVRWNAAAHLGEDLYFEIVDAATGGWGHINVDAFDTNVQVLGYEFDNAGFESGSLDGWTADGEAFTGDHVLERQPHPGRRAVRRQGTYHLWGGGSGRLPTGTLTSPRFGVGGPGRSGSCSAEHTIPRSTWRRNRSPTVRSSPASASARRARPIKKPSSTSPAHVGETVRLRLVDDSTTGHLNVDDIRTLVDDSTPVIDNAAWSTPAGTSSSHCASSPSGATPQNA